MSRIVAIAWCVLTAGLHTTATTAEAAEIPLLDWLFTAETVLETSGITFGTDTPPDVIGAGFSHIEEFPGDRNFTWATGTEAWIHPWLGSRRPRLMTFTVKPFVAPGPRQSISAAWNGELLFHAELDLENQWRTFRIGIPQEVQLEGRNSLRFSFARSDRPIDCFPGNDRVLDARSLSVAFDALVLEETGDFAPGKPVPQSRIEVKEAEESRLLRFVSPGEIRYHLLVPGGTGLHFRYRGMGSADVPFRVQGIAASGEGKELLSATVEARSPGWRSGEVTIDGADGGPYRLTLSCPRGNVEVEEPVLSVPGTMDPEALFRVAAPENPPRTTTADPRPNILIYLVDALRADHLGCYGYPRPTSPNVDSFANSGVVFERAYAHNPWTKNSMAAIMTGRYPSACSMVGTDDALSPDLVTLAERLADSGYACFAFSANGYFSPQFGFDQGFDEFILRKNASREELPVRSDALHEEIVARLDRIAGSQPFFIYVHTVDPHGPYTPIEGYTERFDRGYSGDATGDLAFLTMVHRRYRFLNEDEISHLVDLYDAEIAFNDAQFGALLSELDRRGLSDNLLTVFTSDHGEEFLDHGNLEHSRALYRESLHVPLIVKWSGARAARRVGSLVGHVDLVPTLCEIAGARPPRGVVGGSLVSYLTGSDPEPVARDLFSELNLESMVSLRREGTHVIVSEPGRDWRETPLPRVQWFRTAEDPDEQRNLAEVESIRAGLDAAAALYCRHRARMEWLALGGRSERAEIDEETRRALEAMGYMK